MASTGCYNGIDLNFIKTKENIPNRIFLDPIFIFKIEFMLLCSC